MTKEIWLMYYERFLFSQLLRDIIKEYNEIWYDDLYYISQDIYEEKFIDSKYDDEHQWLYDCMVDFIKWEKELLIKEISDLI